MPPSLSISAFTAKNENTLALAAANFNFSLMTIEPPEEYKILGQQLSSKRRMVAEEGSVHITARKLGALFEQIAQPSAALIKAYGQRVSEISESEVANPKGSSKDGIFREQVGADGTTIWAAATSGRSAIAMNLLACFLARLWSQQEAVAIWVELVESRQKEIMVTIDGSEPSHLAPISAAKQTITKEELAEWDAGARAWLRAGNIVKKREMKQLDLIINNLGLPVDPSQDVYTSVVRAWTTAMDTIGKMISGISYSVYDGAVLLALSSWHIYPNMLVLGEKEKYISQKDSLIPPEVYITIGIQTQPNLYESGTGVCWSLSLARLHQYGSPVRSTRSAGTDAERLSFQEFLFVFLGTFFAGWRRITTDWLLAAELITTIWEAISDEVALSNGNAEKAKEFVKDSSSWLYLLYRTARMLLDSDAVERERAIQLVKAGARASNRAFLSADEQSPAFGLAKLSNYFLILSRKERSHDLLNAMKLPGVESEDCEASTETKTQTTNQEHAKSSTTLKFPRIRAINLSSGSKGAKNIGSDTECSRFVEGYDLISRAEAGQVSYFWVGTGHPPITLTSRFVLNNPDRLKIWGLFVYTAQEFDEMRATLDPTDEYILREFYLSTIFDEDDFESVAGSAIICSIYLQVVHGAKERSLVGIINAFKLKRISIESLIDYLCETWEDLDRGRHSQYIYSLKLMASVAELYKLLPGSTVAISVAQTSLRLAIHSLEPADQHNKFSPFELDRRAAFRIVTFLDAGFSSFDHDIVHDTMAISIGDSIYLAASLLCDPSEAPEDYELRRVTGNVGQPGISFMIPPMNPEIRKRTLGNWRQVNHHDFDGKAQDSFQSTSLHLSLTGYKQSINTRRPFSYLDTEAYILETVVSVLDRGDWVGDLDILGALRSDRFFRLPLSNSCGHLPQIPPTSMPVSIDNWDELLEKPEGRSGIVRANGNWLSRLAATTLSIQSRNITAVVSDKVCWECYQGFAEDTAISVRESEAYEDVDLGTEILIY